MREYQCHSCKAINRLSPKCGKCQSDLVEPALVRASWWLHNHRTDKRLIYPAIGAALIAAYLVATGSPFAPHNRQECEEDAARSGKSAAAMRVLRNLCDEKFPRQP